MTRRDQAHVQPHGGALGGRVHHRLAGVDGLVALDHVHGHHARRRAALGGLDVGPVDAQHPRDLGMPGGVAGHGDRAAGDRLGLLIVQQLEAVDVDLEGAGALRRQAQHALAVHRALARVLACEALHLQHVVAQVGLGGEITQLQAGGGVLEQALGDAGVAGQLGRGQGSGQGPLGVQLAAQLALAPEEQVPDRLQLAVGADLALDRALAVEGEMQRRGAGVGRQHGVHGGVVAGRRALGVHIQGQSSALQARAHRAVQGQLRRRVAAARALQRGVQRAGQGVTLPAQAEVGVEAAGQVLAQGRQVNAGHPRLGVQGLVRLMRVDLHLAAACGQVQPRAALSPRQADLGRLDGAEGGVAHLPMAGEGQVQAAGRGAGHAHAVQPHRRLGQGQLGAGLVGQMGQGP